MTLGVGIVGAGIMAQAHADAVNDHARARVVAITSRTADSAARLAGRVGARSVPTLEELVEAPDVDVVCAATPDQAHADVVVAAATAGKHVIVEKPFTISTADADRAIQAVRRARVKAMVLFNHRWVPAYAQAKDRIAAGDIGEPRLAYARKNDTIFVPTEMIRWASETTCAWFLSSHDLDLVNWLFDDVVTSVFATAVDGVLRRRGVETPDAIQAQVRFGSGAVGTFESCWILPNTFPTTTDSFVEVVGSEGVIHLDRKLEQIEIATNRAFEHPRNILVRTMHGRPSGAVRDAIWHVLDCVLQDRQPLITLESSRHVTAILSAVHSSIRTGQPVDVEPARAATGAE